MATMRCDEYVARIEYDADERLFRGRVLNILDTVTFYGASAKELDREMRRSIRIYLEVCRERGIDPAKPFSGRFNVRLTPEQHRVISSAAAVVGKSLNAWVAETLEREAERALDS
jgi:predicted HicB family RNase H-like nuclease